MESNIVSVMLWGEEVGKLYWDNRGKRAVFSFNPDFVKKGIDIAPLTASTKGAAGNGFPVVGDKRKLYQGLPPFLADSLPDHWGNKVFEHWAAQNRISKQQLSPVDKLAFIGRRGMGALEFIPAVSGLESSNTIQIDSLYKLAQKIFDERQEIFVRDDENMDLQSLYEVGTSAGGQHPKAIIAINDETRDIRSGQVPLPEGYKYYILKFAEGNDFPFTQIEMAYYDMAKEAGIAMTPSRLVHIEGKYHFLTERYDRSGGKKLHTQTLAAINPDADSYDDMFETCRRLSLPANEQSELYRRMVFNVMAGNVDDHVKNFSFMMGSDGEWHITPAYDVTFSTNLDGTIDDYWKDRIEHFLSVLAPSPYKEEMNHYLPVIVEPYKTEDGLEVSDVRIEENPRHDFRIEAVIDGKLQKFIAGRKSDLATEIRNKGRNKMPVEEQKSLVARLLLPLARRDANHHL